MTASVEPFGITFLGTRDAAVGRGVRTTSQLVSCGRTDVLVDAGVGAAGQLMQAGLAPDELEAVVLTHWHPDHVAGLPTLLRRGQGAAAIRLFAPRPPAEAWWHTLRLGSLRRLAATLDVLDAGEELELGALRVATFATDHGTPSLGWRFAERDGERVVVVPGDSRPTPEIAEAACGADLLAFEATFLHRHVERAVASRHATAFEAGTLARAAGVGALALTHLSTRYARAEVAAEAQLAFEPVHVPDDLDRLSVAPRGEGSHGVVTLDPR